MQIIGKNLPQMQSVVSSGLDSVTQGLVQNTNDTATQGLARIKDTFTTEGLNAVNLNPSSSVQAEAGYNGPGGLNKLIHPDSEMGNVAVSLHKLNSKIGSLTDSPGTQQGIIIIGGRFQPSPPASETNPAASMPVDVFQSQLRALGDMETTVQESADLYQQLNSSIQRQAITGAGAWNGNILKAGEGAAKQAAEEAIQVENATVDYAEAGADPVQEGEQKGWGQDEYTREQYEFYARLLFGMFKYPAANPLTHGLW